MEYLFNLAVDTVPNGYYIPGMTNTNMKPINLKHSREALGLNQSEMARAMGVHRNTWIKWERGEDGRQITASPARLVKTLLWLEDMNLLELYLEFFKEKE